MILILAAAATFVCAPVRVIDGDTLRCPQLVRLAGIDAPEMPGHCRKGRKCVEGDPYAARDALRELVKNGPVVCRQTDTDRYGRVVARCRAGNVDLSCAMIVANGARRRYQSLGACPKTLRI